MAFVDILFPKKKPKLSVSNSNFYFIDTFCFEIMTASMVNHERFSIDFNKSIYNEHIMSSVGNSFLRTSRFHCYFQVFQNHDNANKSIDCQRKGKNRFLSPCESVMVQVQQ